MEESNTTAPEQKTSLAPFIGIGIIALVVLIGGAIVWSNNSKPPETVTQQTESPTGVVAGIEDATQTDSTVKTIDLEAGSFYFKPNEIRIKKGQKVKIVMHSVSMMHDFVIDELGVKLPVVKNGETGTIEFTPEESGTFEYYCSVGQHRAQGQVGTLIVE